jgi:cell division protein FtsW (lipid II flippase)
VRRDWRIVRRDWRIALLAILMSLLVTLLRVTGEVHHWSDRWFSSATGGITPSGWSWVVGITWLPLVFGPYFASVLVRAEEPPAAWRVVFASWTAALGVYLGLSLLLPRLSLGFPYFLLAGWLLMVAAAALAFGGWPRLGRVLLAYGLGSRVAVVVVMYLAMRGRWGTHYDYVDMPRTLELPFVPRFLWFAFFPQLVFWTSFTVVLGSLGAGLYLALTRRRRPA